MIKTAKEFLKGVIETPFRYARIVDADKAEEKMIEFTKLHVKAALEEAAKKATMKLTYPKLYEESNETGLTSACAEEISRGGECGIVEIEEDSILNAYPESNIQ